MNGLCQKSDKPNALATLVFFCTTVLANAGHSIEKPVAQPGLTDEERIVMAKKTFGFEEYEAQAPQYLETISDWRPNFVECDGIRNYVRSGSSTRSEQVYVGRDERHNRWINVIVRRHDTSREAHEQMIAHVSNPSRGQVTKDIEIADPERKIGDRCFKLITGRVGKQLFFYSVPPKIDTNAVEITSEEMLFIRNNYFIRVVGVHARIEPLARDLDRQLLELSPLKSENQQHRKAANAEHRETDD